MKLYGYLSFHALVVCTLSITALLSAAPVFSFPAKWTPEYNVRVLFVKDKSVTNLGNPEQSSMAAISYINSVFKKSAVRLMANFSGFENYNGRFQNIAAAFQNPQIEAWRTQHDADLVFIFSNSGLPHGSCGVSRMLSNVRYSIAMGVTSGFGCVQNQTFAHEIGHNLGLFHTKQDIVDRHAQGKILDKPLYAAGWGRPKFVTIMAYPRVHGGSRLGIYSIPTLKLCAGENCGNRDSGYAAKYLNDNLEKNFGHRKIKYPYLTLFDTESIDDPTAQTFVVRDLTILSQYGWANRAKNYYLPTGWAARFFTGDMFTGTQFDTPQNKHSLEPGSPEMAQFKGQMSSVQITKSTADMSFFIAKDADISGQYERLEIVSSMPDIGVYKNVMREYVLPKGWIVRFFDEVNYEGASWTRKWNDDSDIPLPIERIESIEILTQPGE